MENNKKKVMSDEQIETLRMQIASYHNICRMLADFHTCRLTLQPPCRLTLQPPLPDLPQLSDLPLPDPCRLTLQPPLPDPCRLTLQPPLPDPCRLTLQPPLPDLPLPEVEVENTQTLHGGQRRQWTPTREQIEILKSIFKEGEGSYPNKENIKEITAVLSQHGQVSDANVYKWFINRRNRLKKKMHDQNKQMMKKMTYRFDHGQLVSTSSHCYYYNDDDDNNNDDDDDQVESMS